MNVGTIRFRYYFHRPTPKGRFYKATPRKLRTIPTAVKISTGVGILSMGNLLLDIHWGWKCVITWACCTFFAPLIGHVLYIVGKDYKRGKDG